MSVEIGSGINSIMRCLKSDYNSNLISNLTRNQLFELGKAILTFFLSSIIVNNFFFYIFAERQRSSARCAIRGASTMWTAYWTRCRPLSAIAIMIRSGVSRISNNMRINVSM